MSEGPVTVSATAAKAEVTVGERFVVEVVASGPPGATVTFPPELVTDGAELHTLAAPPGASPLPPPPAGHHRYETSVFALGSGTVPPIAVTYRLADGSTGTVSTEPITVKVGTLIAKDEKEPALADIRPPVPVGISPLFWGALGVLALLLVALVWRWWSHRRPAAKAVVPERAVPADVEANTALDALARSGLVARGELRAFYIRLMDIAKLYLERRLDAPVMEMTTQEAIAFLLHHPRAGEVAGVLRDVAGAADQVKFARGLGVGEEAARHLGSVRDLVTALEARLSPTPAAALPEARRVAL